MGLVRLDVVACNGWKWIEPPARVQQKAPPASAPTAADVPAEMQSATGKFAVFQAELRKLASAEQAWAEASLRFQRHPCDRTAAGVVDAQLAMIVQSASLVTYLRERTTLLNLTPR